MENNKKINKSQFSNPIINNDNKNIILNIENQINNNKKHNINEKPNKIFNKRNNYFKIHYEPSNINANNFINETNPNINENFGNFINENNFIDNNNNIANIPGIFGGNDNNHNNQFNDLQRMKRNETFAINEENNFKYDEYDDILKEDKKINKFTEKKSLNKNRHIKNCNSNFHLRINDKKRNVINLKNNVIKLEKPNINKINSHKNSVNKNNKNNNLKKNEIKIENQNINDMTFQSNRINTNNKNNNLKKNEIKIEKSNVNNINSHKNSVNKNNKNNNLKKSLIKLEKPNINNINFHKNSVNKNNKNNNLKKNEIKIENQNINDITIQRNRINKNQNQNKIPEFNQTMRNENRKEREIIPPYYKNLYRKYKNIFGDLNIFNSILIILNNIQDVDCHLSKDKRKDQIEKLEENFRYSLASILFHANQYIYNKEKIHSKDIFNKYTEFTNCFSKLNYRQNDKCLFDINNMEYILEFIYKKINCEFKFVNSICTNNNNYNNYYTNINNNYFEEFGRNNRSMISDMFTGFYQYNNNYLNSQRNLFNGQNYSFKYFSFIKFNLDEINQFYDSTNINEMNLNCFYNNINLISCFDYTFKDKIHSIYSLPNILTIVLSQTDKCNFILHHGINLKEYTTNFSNNNNCSYLLTSILCQMSYNKKFINYIFDAKNESWFSLSDQEMKEVDSIDINATPLILIYKLKTTFEQEYKGIKIKDKLCTNINFQDGLFQTTKLFFDQSDIIKDVRSKIKSWFKIKESFTLLINGRLAKDSESLSIVLEKGCNILVIPKSN